MNFDRNRIAAFTLIEILVALTIIGVLMSFIAPLVFDRPDQARLLKVKNDQKAIETSLRLFKLDNGTFPAAELGLNALLANGLTSNGYLPEEPMDPWGKPYKLDYLSSGEIVVVSLGPDGQLSDLSEAGDYILGKPFK